MSSPRTTEEIPYHRRKHVVERQRRYRRSSAELETAGGLEALLAASVAGKLDRSGHSFRSRETGRFVDSPVK